MLRRPPEREACLLAVVLVSAVGLTPVPGGEPRALPMALSAVFQQPEPAARSAAFVPHAPGRTFIGVTRSCFNCHYKSTEAEDLPPEFAGTVSDDDWVLLNEVRTWVTTDKHRQAYTVLVNERSQQMARILGVVDENGESQIHRDVRCLTCHVGMPLDQMSPGPDGLVAAETTRDPRFNLGVSCESCHGAAGTGDAAGWADVHYQKDPWRFLAPGKKWQDHGYYDVRSPVARTRMCASCHVGNADAGRIVTHEMYAAGHPPLPGFEVETFIEQEPQHWRDFAQKREAVRQEFLDKTGRTWDPADLHETQDLLIGALVNLSEYLKLTAHLADSSVKLPVARPEWPELAQFSCYACHHELQVPSWRQERGYWLVPGRPTPHEWPFALLQAGSQAAGQTRAEVDQQLSLLAEPLNAQPFGSPQALSGAARRVAAWAERAAAQLEKQPITPERGRAMLKELAQVASRQTLDYDSARQVVWAFNVIYQDLSRGDEPAPFNPSVEEIGWFARRENLDALEQKLTEFDRLLLLDLRKGRTTQQTIPGVQQARPVLEVDLGLVLAPIGAYDPAKFRAQFAEVARLLDQQVVGAR
jgi:Cytochrome c554 and c-prime